MSIQRAIEILEEKANDTLRYAASFRGAEGSEQLMSDLAKTARSYRDSIEVLKSSPDYLNDTLREQHRGTRE